MKQLFLAFILATASTAWASTKSANNHVRAAPGEAMAGKAVSVSATSPCGCAVKY